MCWLQISDACASFVRIWLFTEAPLVPSLQLSLTLNVKWIQRHLISHLDAVWLMRYETSSYMCVLSQWTLDFHFCHWPLTQYVHACILLQWEIHSVEQEKKNISICASSIIIVTISLVVISNPLLKGADPWDKAVTLERQPQPSPFAPGLLRNESLHNRPAA